MGNIIDEMLPEKVLEKMAENDCHPCEICGRPKSIYEEGYVCEKCKEKRTCKLHGDRFMSNDGHCLKCEDIENDILIERIQSE